MKENNMLIRKKYFENQVIFGLFLLLAISSCKKDPDVSTGLSQNNNSSVGIKTFEDLCGIIQFERDTFYLHKLESNSKGYRTLEIICKSDDSTALDYEWFCPGATFIDSIGVEIMLSFNPDSIEIGSTESLSITLTTVTQGNSLKTVSKTIRIKKQPIPWLGEFRGYNSDNPSDTFSVFFTRTDQYGVGPACCTTYTVKNLPDGLNTFMKIPDIQSSFDFTLNSECDPETYEEVAGFTMSAPKGFGKVSGNSIVIDYYYMTPMPDSGNSTVIYKKFIGSKVQ